MSKLVPVGVYPLAVVMGGAIVGLGYFLNHLVREIMTHKRSVTQTLCGLEGTLLSYFNL
jgi:hypothetical protein